MGWVNKQKFRNWYFKVCSSYLVVSKNNYNLLRTYYMPGIVTLYTNYYT